MRVLVIDDNPLMVSAMVQMLADAGYEVVSASNGVEGLRQFEKQRPDVVICDILMPEQDGIETIRRIRRLSPEVGIAAISGGGASEGMIFLDMALSFGANEVLSKPFRASALLEMVKRLAPA